MDPAPLLGGPQALLELDATEGPAAEASPEAPVALDDAPSVVSDPARASEDADDAPVPPDEFPTERPA